MDLTLYKPTELEELVSKKYRDHGIHYAADLDVDHIAAIFNAIVILTKDEPRTISNDTFALIKLSAYAKKEELRRQFFHELVHVILHAGNQHSMPEPFVRQQERQASQYKLCIAMPAYLLEEFKYIERRSTYIKVLSEEFSLPIAFVERRIEQIERNIFQAKLDDEFRADMNPVRIEYDYSPETRRVLAQLFGQLTRGVARNG